MVTADQYFPAVMVENQYFEASNTGEETLPKTLNHTCLLKKNKIPKQTLNYTAREMWLVKKEKNFAYRKLGLQAASVVVLSASEIYYFHDFIVFRRT